VRFVGPLARAISSAPLLSIRSSYGDRARVVCGGSWRWICHARANWVSHVRSRAACAAAIYSASALEWATVAYLELTQWMGPPAKVNTIPVVERRESGHCAQSESQNACRDMGTFFVVSEENVRPRSRVPRRYRRTRWVAAACVGSVRAVRSYRVKRVKIMMHWSLECYSSKAERELYTTKMRGRRRRCKMIVPRFDLT
jgi:hypothetical protein